MFVTTVTISFRALKELIVARTAEKKRSALQRSRKLQNLKDSSKRLKETLFEVAKIVEGTARV